MAVKSKIRNPRIKTKDRFGRIGVLIGGPSSERAVSLKSGEAVCEGLKQLGLEVVPIDIKTDDLKENIRLIKSCKIDCTFIALHGRFGEDGQIQEILDNLKIPYTGSGRMASRLAMDKIASRKIFQVHGLDVPRYKVMNRFCDQANLKIYHRFTLPLVVKPAGEGSSIGISIVQRRENLDQAIDLAFRFDEKIIIEEYIPGREVTVGILQDAALPVIEVIPKRPFFDYQAKYQSGMTDYIVPAKLETGLAKKIQRKALSAHRLIGCSGFSRVDMILSPDHTVFILEVNSIPGLTSTSLLPKAAREVGIEFPQLCLKLIKLAYEKT